MTVLFQTLLQRHVDSQVWGRTPYKHPDGRWIYIHQKSRLEVRETLFPDDADEGKTMQHLELHSKVAPVRWEQWSEVYRLWIGDALASQGEGALSWRRITNPDGSTLYYLLNAWYTYPEAVIRDYLAKKDRMVRA